MKRIGLLILVLLIPSSLAHALMMVPTATVTIVKNTVSEDGIFNFKITDTNVAPDIIEEFNITTQNYTGNYTTSLPIFGSSSSYYLTELVPSDWQLSGVVCISNSPDSFSAPASNGGVRLTLASYTHMTCTFTNQRPQQQLDPVIIIPGIMGSAQKNGQWVIDPILHTYDDLIETFKANGYEENRNLFTFPYEWRDSNFMTALLLRDKINEVQQICNCDKVDIVAHSMGGLVARQYIQSNDYEYDIDQLIFLGTPHLGAQGSYLAWEAGETEKDFYSKLQKTFFSAEAIKNGYLNLFDYIQNRPIASIKELLPVFDYLKDKDSGEIRQYPNNYPRNEFLENLNATLSDLTSSGVSVANIIGNSGQNTIEKIRIGERSLLGLGRWEHGEPDGFYSLFGDHGLERGAGDDTVTVDSATNKGFFVSEEINFSHHSLPTAAESKIFQILTGHSPNVTYDHGFNLSPKVLLMQLFSPVDLVIVAPDGKKMGKNFETGEEYNEIENAFYSGYQTDNEYITILNPLDGEYKILTQGTDQGGEYRVASAFITDAAVVEKAFAASTSPAVVQELHLTLDSQTPENMHMEPADQMPPEIIISSPQSRDYSRLERIPVEVAVSDLSGVGWSHNTLDGVVSHSSLIDPFYLKLGEHQFSVSAADNFGNVATSTVNFRLIATVESTISDINRAYELGWIEKEKIKNRLIEELKNIIKWRHQIEVLEHSDKNPKQQIIDRLEQKITKKLIKTLLKELERDYYKKGVINRQVYELLKEDLEWLLTN